MQSLVMNNHSPEQLLALLEAAIREAPPFPYGETLSERERRWLGRVDALLEASGTLPALVAFRVARQAINTYSHSRDDLLLPLHDAYSRMDLMAPVASQNAFIPAGDTWNGYAALIKLVQNECDDLLIVDPYLNATIYTDFLPHSQARVGVRCLTTKRGENHAGLSAASTKWSADTIGTNYPVEVRYAQSGALHDRLIILDKSQVWLVSQSFKDIAKRSPASVSKADVEMASMKFDHYDALWSQSSPL